MLSARPKHIASPKHPNNNVHSQPLYAVACCSNTRLEKTVDTADRKLQSRAGGPAHGLLLVSLLVAHGALGTLPRQTFRSLARHLVPVITLCYRAEPENYSGGCALGCFETWCTRLRALAPCPLHRLQSHFPPRGCTCFLTCRLQDADCLQTFPNGRRCLNTRLWNQLIALARFSEQNHASKFFQLRPCTL